MHLVTFDYFIFYNCFKTYCCDFDTELLCNADRALTGYGCTTVNMMDSLQLLKKKKKKHQKVNAIKKTWMAAARINSWDTASFVELERVTSGNHHDQMDGVKLGSANAN